MHGMSEAIRSLRYPDYAAAHREATNDNSTLQCDWVSLCEQLLAQWKYLTREDLNRTGYNRRRIAMLVQRKYGVSAPLIENYLANLERTLPVQGGAHVC